MRVTILGATGGTGQILVNKALVKGYEVTVLARDPSKVSPRTNLTIEKGDSLNRADVKRAVTGSKVVLTALGGRDLKASTLLEESAKNIVSAMEELGVKRLIVLGASGALHDSMKHQTSGRKLFFWIIRNTLLKHPMRDSGNQERIVEASTLDYTIVHPPRLIDAPEVGSYRVALDGLPAAGRQISRADVAEFMICQVESNEFVRQGPYLSL